MTADNTPNTPQTTAPAPEQSAPDASPTAAQDVTAPPATTSAMLGSERVTLAQLVLGSALLVTDEVNERLFVREEVLTATRTPESVFRPVSEWEEFFEGRERLQQASFLTVGMAQDAGAAARAGLEFADEVTDTAGRVVGRVVGPVWRSAPLQPVRTLAHRLQRAGEAKVADWIDKGQRESYRSRAVAEVSLSNFVTESVIDMSRNAQVQGVVQEVMVSPDVQRMIERAVAQQSTSLLDTIVEEVRQRLFAIDLAVERVLRRALRRRPREELPRPPFREAYAESRQPFWPTRDLMATGAGDYAGFVSRFVAFVIDLVFLLVGYTLATAFVTGTLDLFRLNKVISDLMTNNPNLQVVASAAVGAVGFLIILGYGVLSWYFTGETPGDWITGVRVVGRDGGRVPLTRSVIRFIGCFIAALFLFIGFLWALIDDRRQGWHDKLAGTFVIYDWPATPDTMDMLRGQWAEAKSVGGPPPQ